MPTSGVSLGLEWNLEAHSAPVSLVAEGPYGILATGAVDMELKVWRGRELVARTGLQSINDKFRPMDRMRGLAFDPSGARIFAAAGERLWCFDTATLEEVWSYQAPNMVNFLLSSPQDVAVTFHGEIVFSVDSGHFEVWTLDGKKQARWADNDAPATLVMLADGDRFVGCDGYSVCAWSVAERRKCARIDPRTRAFAFSASPETGWFAIRTLHTVQVWDWSSASVVFEQEVSQGAPVLALLPEVGWVAYAEEGGVTVVDPDPGTFVRLAFPGVRTTKLASTPDGRGLLVGRSDGSVGRYAVA
ncbi:MAG: WD40 repeat domain-containing protein [Fimbriimonadaceae bacterium]|nr:WD40 repeat domain-containing protein [Fimbriimonadaceae bacterium]QYK58839.1 MAG: WD40 repeat domain-containing protein [Fimbriimonadaceae bacterium]